MAVRPTDPEALQLFQLIGAPLLAVIQAEAQAAQVSADYIKRIGFGEARAAGGATPAHAGPAVASSARPSANAGNDTPADGTDKRWLQEGGDFGALRLAEFRIDRRAPDGTDVSHLVRVPVLSLFPIPLLQVKHADFEFDIKVLSRVPLSAESEIPPAVAARLAERRAAAQPDAKAPPPDAQQEPARNVTNERAELSSDYLAKQRVELKGFLATSRGGDKASVDASIKVKVRMEQSDMPAGLIHLMKIMGDSVSVTPAALVEQAQARDAQANPKP